MAEIESLVLGKLRAAIHPQIELDTAIIDEGLLDSFAAVELVTELEDELGIRFAPDDFTPEGFATPRAIAALAAGARDRKDD